MDYTKFNTGFNKPAIFTAQTYGTKTSVELDHSDLDLNEVMDVFHTLIVGMGYNPDMWKQWIMERADEYLEEERENCEEKYREDEIEFHNKVKDAIKKRMEADDDIPGWMKPNDVLIDAKKQYDEQLKMDSKPVKKRKKKTVEDWEDEIELGGHE